MALITRTSTFSLHNNLLSNSASVQTRLFDAQDQLSSGLKTNNFAGLSGQVEQFTFLEARIRESVNFQENNAINISRLQTTQTHLSGIIDIVDDVENLITLRRNPALAEDINFSAQLEANIRAIAGELNSSFDGKFLFSGTRTNVAPVQTEPNVPAPFETGVPDISYYQGSQEDVILRVDDNIELTSRVRADDSAFQKIFAAAYQAIEGDVANDDDTLIASLDLLQEGLDEVIALESSVNADILTIENISQRQNSLQLYWEGVTQELSRTDILSVSTQVSIDQTILSASFQAFASISSLSLVNFLN